MPAFIPSVPTFVRLPLLAALALAGTHTLSGCAGGMQAYNNHHAVAAASPAMAPYLRSCARPGNLLKTEHFGAVEISPAVGAHFRPVFFSDGTADSVSVREGHRVMYAFQDAGYYFANVKIERSDFAVYPRDKEVILRQLRSIDDGVQGDSVLNGMEVHWNEADSLDLGGTVGIYTIFLDRDHVVVTAYLLNQGKTHRRFGTMAEYRAVRDRFLDGLTRCVLEAVPAAAPEP